VKSGTSFILVTGANGFVGRSLCSELYRQGSSVKKSLRLASDTDDGYEQVIVDSIDSDTDWSVALDNVNVVIHLAARVHVMNEVAVDPLAIFRQVNVEGTLNLARQAAVAGVKRFIFISTIGVNGNATSLGQPFTSENEPQPHDPYSISKFEAEQGLRMLGTQMGMDIVIIRPPLVYGYEAPGNFDKIIKVLKKKIPLPFGAIKNKRSFVYVENLVSLIVKCINHPAAANQVFLVSDGRDISTTELLKQCADQLGVNVVLLPIPQKLIEFGAAILGKRDIAQRLCGNLQVDITKTSKLLDWMPPVSVSDGLKISALGLTQEK
jgi:nucleoside-diphosphate-sugar epimerase